MKQNYPGIRFERYADDIIIHARRKQIAKSILGKLTKRFADCGFTIHPTKTKIVCLDRSQSSTKKRETYTYDIGGFTFKPKQHLEIYKPAT